MSVARKPLAGENVDAFNVNGHVDPPPAYSEIGTVAIDHEGTQTQARVTGDGRVNVMLNEQNGRLTRLLRPVLQQQQKQQQEAAARDLSAKKTFISPVPLNVVIQIVGTREDVQPFIALGRMLQDQHHHRVRLATHPVFQELVESNGLEFFNIGGSPIELSIIGGGDLDRRKEVAEILEGCWRSCVDLEKHPSEKPFIADAIIANPISLAHVHCAEKLDIPLHIMFTMPWSPTTSFPHPLANIYSSNTSDSTSNCVSYSLVELLIWQGLSDVINRFRQKTLGLEPLSAASASGLLNRLQVPQTYCWSPSLIPKPMDWGDHISVAGFIREMSMSYTPSAELVGFLNAGPRPIYIGFGSTTVDDPQYMIRLIFDAVHQSGQRALVHNHWRYRGHVPANIFLIDDNCPPDWVFQHVSCVVHHGSAEITSTGIKHGKPTVIIPFHRDQPFWGARIAQAGVGPEPIPYQNLSVDNLADAIEFALRPSVSQRARELGNAIREERDGCQVAVDEFHRNLQINDMRCSVMSSEKAVWKFKKYPTVKLRLSAMAATLLAHEGLLDLNDLKPIRTRTYHTEDGPLDPISGGLFAMLGSIGGLGFAIADMPLQVVKSVLAPYASSTSRKSLQWGSIRSRPPAIQSHQPSPEVSQGISKSKPKNSSRKAFAYGFYKELSGKETVAAHKSQSQSSARNTIISDAAKGTGKSLGRIASLSLRTPLGFSTGIAKGFRNAPRLYGDDNIRRPDKITGFHSGVKTAGKELGLGFYDGIAGIVTQPIRGAKEGGVSGFVGGVFKGLGGLILKPGAAIFGIPAHSFQGVYEEVQKHLGHNLSSYIFTTHYLEGCSRIESLNEKEKAGIIHRWKECERQAIDSDIIARWQRRRGPKNTSSSSSPPSPDMIHEKGSRAQENTIPELQALPRNTAPINTTTTFKWDSPDDIVAVEPIDPDHKS